MIIMSEATALATHDLKMACHQIETDIPPLARKLKEASDGAIDAALELARSAKYRTPSSGTIKVVRPDQRAEPESVGELTNRFMALK